MTLSENEMNCLRDINNGGFSEALIPRGADRAEWNAIRLKANVLDTFEFLYPGAYGEKWTIDEKALAIKLMQASVSEISELADQITVFWDQAPSADLTPA